jgi:hypothetical protein
MLFFVAGSGYDRGKGLSSYVCRLKLKVTVGEKKKGCFQLWPNLSDEIGTHAQKRPCASHELCLKYLSWIKAEGYARKLGGGGGPMFDLFFSTVIRVIPSYVCSISSCPCLRDSGRRTGNVIHGQRARCSTVPRTPYPAYQIFRWRACVSSCGQRLSSSRTGVPAGPFGRNVPYDWCLCFMLPCHNACDQIISESHSRAPQGCFPLLLVTHSPPPSHN